MATMPHASDQSCIPGRDFTAELRNADIVMKGGITSGVVYPGAVVELAQAFRFRSIGGTSAGAIAAAATAAAEFGRQNGTGTGFCGVKGLPDWLAGGDGDRLFVSSNHNRKPRRFSRWRFRSSVRPRGGRTGSRQRSCAGSRRRC